eukprot:2798833-Amphidinium_carterae.1
MLDANGALSCASWCFGTGFTVVSIGEAGQAAAGVVSNACVKARFHEGLGCFPRLAGLGLLAVRQPVGLCNVSRQGLMGLMGSLRAQAMQRATEWPSAHSPSSGDES